LRPIWDDLAFFTAPVSAGRVDINVTSGYFVTVQFWSDDCSLRSGAPDTLYCYQGAPCSLPLPTWENIGSPLSYNNNHYPNLSGGRQMRIVVQGHDATFTIAQFTGSAACASVPSGSFCSGIVSSAFGSGANFGQKDAYAQDFYNLLVNAFTSGSSCSCGSVAQACYNALKTYACAEVYGTCTGQLSEPQVASYGQCSAVENACPYTFAQVGLAQYDCGHNNIPGGTVFTTNPNVLLFGESNPTTLGGANSNGLSLLLLLLSIFSALIFSVL